MAKKHQVKISKKSTRRKAQRSWRRTAKMLLKQQVKSVKPKVKAIRRKVKAAKPKPKNKPKAKAKEPPKGFTKVRPPWVQSSWLDALDNMLGDRIKRPL